MSFKKMNPNGTFFANSFLPYIMLQCASKRQSGMTANIIGIIGVSIVVSTYFLLQIQKMDAKGFWYSFLNAFGSILIAYSLMYNWNLASFVIEFFWITISLYGIYQWHKNKSRQSRDN